MIASNLSKKHMLRDMKTTLTRLFTVMMLIMVSMGAKADVKVLFGENGDDTFKSDGGTIEVKQEASKKDATKITVYLIVTPNKGYSMKEKDAIEAYATAPANINPTRAPQASEKLTLDCDNFKDEYSVRTYHVDIDPNHSCIASAQPRDAVRAGHGRGGIAHGVGKGRVDPLTGGKAGAGYAAAVRAAQLSGVGHAQDHVLPDSLVVQVADLYIASAFPAARIGHHGGVGRILDSAEICHGISSLPLHTTHGAETACQN